MGSLVATASLSIISCIINQRRSLLTASRNFSSFVLLTFMRSGTVRRGSLWLSRTNGQPDGRRSSFTTKYPCMFANGEGNLSMLSVRT
jgi:hypothetical protein